MATSDDTWRTTFEHAFELWFTPEIQRRQDAGLIARPFPLEQAQVLFQDRSEPRVRLNGEVKGFAHARVAQGVQVSVGDPVYTDQIEAYDSFELPEEDADCGHFTLIAHRGSWSMMFDFARNKRRASGLVELSGEFLAAARFCAEQQHTGAYVENLWGACELLAKAHLIPISLDPNAKSHGVIQSSINSWRKLGNIESEFVDLFNDLWNSRHVARYAAAGEIRIRAGDRAIAIVQNELQSLQARYRRSAQGAPNVNDQPTPLSSMPLQDRTPGGSEEDGE